MENTEHREFLQMITRDLSQSLVKIMIEKNKDVKDLSKELGINQTTLTELIYRPSQDFRITTLTKIKQYIIRLDSYKKLE
jgi:DNA-binding Xre family transcriptional regulator